jgi:2-desacetyl-2-hydroxyethyl bacteriochlorophyllide A dehydrogenase
VLAFRRFGPNEARLVEAPRPEPGPGELLLRPRASGICGTDLHVLHGEGLAGIPVPLTMGHEVCGEVVGLGPGVSAPRVGDRVVVEPLLPCGGCYFCRRGHPNVCPAMSHLGVWRDGNFAEYVTVPADRATRLPDTVSDVDGLLVEVTACGLNALDRAGLRAGERVLVVGGGPMGQLTAQCALAAGAGLVMLSEPSPERRALAGAAGVHELLSPNDEDVVARVRSLTDGLGADVVVECVGLEATVQQALDATRRLGRCVISGLPGAALRLELTELVFGEKQLLGSLASAWQFGRTVALVASGRIAPSRVVSAVRPFAELPQALADAQSRRDLCKIVIDHTGGTG